MTRTREATLWIAPMASYEAADPSTDGSASYVYVPCEGVAARSDTLSQLATNYASGSVDDTIPEVGPDGGEITFKTTIGASVTAAGAGALGADDWLDLLMLSAFGTQDTRDGLGVGGSSTTSNLVLESDGADIQDLLPIYEAGLAPGRTQWTQVTVDPADGSYTVAPVFGTAPTTAAICYAVKSYRFAEGGGPYVAAVFRRGSGTRTYLGGRVCLKSISAETGGRYIAEWSIRFNRHAADAGKSALPAVLAGPAFRPLQATLSPFYFGGTTYETKRISIQFAPEMVAIGATSGTQGRSGDEVIRYNPKVTIEPQWAAALEELPRDLTPGTLVAQLGGGVLASGHLPTMCFAVDRAHVVSAPDSDDSGVARTSVTFAMHKRINFSGTTPAVNFQIVRP